MNDLKFNNLKEPDEDVVKAQIQQQQLDLKQ